MPNFRKIFQSFDFRNNKIKDAKVDAPTHEDHVVSSKYVLSQTVYKTTKAQTFPNPFTFNWIFAPYNKSVLQLFDDLFFPRILPIYENPNVIEFNIKRLEYNGKCFFNGLPFDIIFDFKILANDRLSNEVPFLFIEYVDGDTDEIILDSSSYNQTVTKTISVTKEISDFELRWNFNPTTITKQDTYGDDYVDPTFQLLYTLKFDILKEITKKFQIEKSPLFFKPIINFADFEDFDVIDYSTSVLTGLGFIRTAKNLTLPLNRDFFIFLVPVEIMEFNRNYINDLPISKEIFNYTKNIEIDNVNYYAFFLSVGTFDVETIAEFKIY